MKIEEIKEVLNKIKFAPSNLDMGWKWDIKPTKIFDTDNTILEKGYSIRTTFMRPDINTSEIEKGYGRWMYIPDNISQDGIVKTAWVCSELIVKHELMEAFLYNNNRIFDPHKSIKDLSHNSRQLVVDNVDESNIEDNKESSGVIFEKQNVKSHYDDITDLLDGILGNGTGNNRNNNIVYTKPYWDKNIYITGDSLTLSVKSSGKVLEILSEDSFNFNAIKKLVNENFDGRPDPSEMSQIIIQEGFTDSVRKELDNGLYVWLYRNPNKNQYLSHFEDGKLISKVSAAHDLLLTISDDTYTKEKLLELIKSIS